MKEIKIKRFFECLIPVTICNLKCDYCYVIQRDSREMKMSSPRYTPEYIGKCLSVERLGGVCFFSICGAGETLIPKETLEIVHQLLKNGHIVNVTTNGTLTNRFQELENFTNDELSRLHFSFSFHYLELKRLGLVDSFFSNINYVRSKGASILVQFNLCDEYIPYIDEIKNLCLHHVGAYPQVAATRREQTGLKGVELYTLNTVEDYIAIGNQFNSELFSFTMENFNKKRKEFCYAGERSGVLDLETGALRKCYADPRIQYIFSNPDDNIEFEAIGNHCHCSFCFNSSHFMSLGVIDNGDERTYCGIRNRKEANWFNPTMEYALSNKLSDQNEEYTRLKKLKINIKQSGVMTNYKCKCVLRKISNKIGRFNKK